jgi:hypothetical protein
LAVPFNPGTLSEVLAWYQVDLATVVSTRITVLPDAKGGASFVPVLSALAPVQGTTANGLKVLTFTGAEALGALDNNAAWRNSEYFGMAFWFKASAETGQGTFFSYWGSTLGMTANRVLVGSSANTRVRQIVRNAADSGSSTLDSATGASHFVIKTDVWQFFAFLVDGRLAAADRSKVKLGGADLPLPQTPTVTPAPDATLRTSLAAPNRVALGCADVDDGTSAIAGGILGQIGPDIVFFNPAMKIGKLRRIMGYRVPRG